MEIIREDEFDEQILIICEDYNRMDELDSAIDWALAKNPEGVPGTVHLGEGFYLWITEELVIKEIPAVAIIYHYDGDYTVTLISIEAI